MTLTSRDLQRQLSELEAALLTVERGQRVLLANVADAIAEVRRLQDSVRELAWREER